MATTNAIKESEHVRQSRRQRVTEMYLQGKNQFEIATELKVVRQTIWLDLKAIRQEWRTSILSNFSQMQQKELAVIDQAEATAWEGYERSLEPVTRKTKKTRTVLINGKQKKLIDITEVTEPGKADSTFITQVLRCVAQRCNILGLTEGDMMPPTAPTAPVTINNNTIVLDKVQEIGMFKPEQLDAIKQLSALLRPQLETEEVKTDD